MSKNNQVQLIGFVGQDPKTGDNWQSFSLATNESYKDKSGNWVDRSEWHNVTKFGDPDKLKISKGDKLLVRGKIQTEEYDGKYYTKIIAFDIQQMLKPNRNPVEVDDTKENEQFDDLPF